MGQWFAPLDDALGGIGDVTTGLFSTAGDAAGDAAGGLFGGLFGGLGNWLFQLAALAVFGFVAIKVFA
jgi:hypothetical protein